MFERQPVDEMSVLGWLHNLNATDEDRALTAHDLSERMDIDFQQTSEYLERLVELRYVSAVEREGQVRYYLNPQGILRVVRTYT